MTSNLAGARAAKKAVDLLMAKDPTRPRFVAGAMGPTQPHRVDFDDVHSAATRGVTYDELVQAYYDQARGLLDGGADILLVETIFDTLNSKAAFFAIATLLDERKIPVPSWPRSLLFNRQQPRGHRADRRSVLEFYSHVPLLSVGMNCALGPKEMRR